MSQALFVATSAIAASLVLSQPAIAQNKPSEVFLEIERTTCQYLSEGIGYPRLLLYWLNQFAEENYARSSGRYVWLFDQETDTALINIAMVKTIERCPQHGDKIPDFH